MTTMEMVRAAVEEGLERWCDEDESGDVQETVNSGSEGAQVRMRNTSAAVEGGIYFQRCGGGRRRMAHKAGY